MQKPSQGFKRQFRAAKPGTNREIIQSTLPGSATSLSPLAFRITRSLLSKHVNIIVFVCR